MSTGTINDMNTPLQEGYATAKGLDPSKRNVPSENKDNVNESTIQWEWLDLFENLLSRIMAYDPVRSEDDFTQPQQIVNKLYAAANKVVARDSSTILFDEDAKYWADSTAKTPLAGAFTLDFTDAKYGVRAVVYHQDASEPAWASQIKWIAGTAYEAGTLNYIHLTYIDDNEVHGWIVQLGGNVPTPIPNPGGPDGHIHDNLSVLNQILNAGSGSIITVGERNKIAALGDFRGVHDDPAALNAAHPTGAASAYAIVLSTQTLWGWNTVTGAWEDTTVSTSGTVAIFSGSGTTGQVPDPATGYTGQRLLREDGTWATPTFPSIAWGDISGKPPFAPVATSGSYDDLSNKPPFAPVATSGSYDDLSNKPPFAPVATSGSYIDLSNKPTIPVLPTEISQAEAEAGTSTTPRLWTAQRVAQAIAALGSSGVTAPTVTSIGTLQAGTRGDITIIGTEFNVNTEVTILDNTVHEVSYVSATELIVNVTANSNPATYDVFVDNGQVVQIDKGFTAFLPGFEEWFNYKNGGDAYTIGSANTNDVYGNTTLCQRVGGTGEILIFSDNQDNAGFVKLDHLEWDRSSKKTLHLLVRFIISGTANVYVGLADVSSNEAASNQAAQSDGVIDYREGTNSNNINVRQGNFLALSPNTTQTVDNVHRITISNNGETGGEIKIYEKDSGGVNFNLDDYNDLRQTFTINNNSKSPLGATIIPFIAFESPVSSGNDCTFYIYGAKITQD